jgi:hypothetical protein
MPAARGILYNSTSLLRPTWLNEGNTIGFADSDTEVKQSSSGQATESEDRAGEYVFQLRGIGSARRFSGRFLLPALGIGPATFMLVVAARMNLNWFVRRKLGTGKARQIPSVGRRDSKK